MLYGADGLGCLPNAGKIEAVGRKAVGMVGRRLDCWTLPRMQGGSGAVLSVKGDGGGIWKYPTSEEFRRLGG